MKQVKVDGDAAIKILEGNWWKFPPPCPGVYDVRKPGEVSGSYTLYERVRVDDHRHKQGSLTCMGMVCHTQMKLAGYDFRFPIGHSASAWPIQSCFVPYHVLYTRMDNGLHKTGQERILQLPIARSIEEARYVITRLQELWPEFHGQHIEYQEEKV